MSKLKNATVIAAIMAISPTLLASSDYRSSIGGIDLSATYNPPDDVAPIICRDQERDSTTGKDDVQGYKACQMGVAAARFMAEKYAAGEGKFLGCVDGLQQGIFNGYIANKNPSAEMINEARGKYSKTEMTSAVSRASSEADQQGESVAAGEIISRFRSVVGTGGKPDSRYTYPDHNFGGYENGYEYDNRSGSFDAVYRLGWVNRNSSISDKISARAVYNLSQTGSYGRDRLCQPTEVLFDNLGTFTLWDFYSVHGRYDFSRFGWRNVNRSWDFFVNRESGHITKLYYQNEITDKTEQYVEEYTVKVPRTVMEPVLGADGKPTGEYRERTIEVDERRTRVATRVIHPKAYYQNIYGESFREAYDQYYITQYFGRGFVEAHRNSRNLGELAGAAIGQGVAKDTADELAYDAKYKNDSISAYATRWRTNYDTQWSQIWDKFAKNAMVELNEMSIAATENDDILKAGEAISARFTVTNLGLKSDNINVSMFGDLAEKSKIFSTLVPSQTSTSFATGVLANVSNSAQARDHARLGVKISGAMNFAQYLQTEKSGSFLINEVAEINKVSGSLSVVSGAGSMTAELVNPSSKETTSLVTLRLDLGKLGSFSTETLKLNAKESRLVTLQFGGLDPLDVIENGGISGDVETLMNGRVLHDSSLSLGLDRDDSIVEYFNALVTGLSKNSGTDSIDGRVQELMNIIQDKMAATAKNVDWSNDSRVAQTLVGKLGRSYQSAQASGTLNEAAKAKYNQLGVILDNIDPGTFKRKAYRAALNRFAPAVQVKKKSK